MTRIKREKIEPEASPECLLDYDLEKSLEQEAETPEEKEEESRGLSDIELVLESVGEIIDETYPGLAQMTRIRGMILRDVQTALEYWLKDGE